MTPASNDVAIIGAGPAGLGAGIALGKAAFVLERSAEAGGLCQTIEQAGAIFDLGGHSFHTPHQRVRDLVFRSIPMEEQVRQAWCHIEGEWIPYPFQKNFTALKNDAVREACRSGLEAARDTGRSTNFDRYLDERFGAGIARHFMRPYNEKLWGANLSRLATNWTTERIAAPSTATERFQTDGGRRTPLQSDTMVAYPAHGGFGEIYRALARNIPGLHFNQVVSRIDPFLRELTTVQGKIWTWKRIISTLPLPMLLQLLPNVPETLGRAVAQLEALPINLVLLSLRGRCGTPKQRVYCPGPEITGHKIVLNHNSSAYLRDLPRHGIQVEISGYRNESDDGLIRLAVKDLQLLRLLKNTEEIETARVIRLPMGYPIPTQKRAEIVSLATSWLESQGIWSVGRFGEWAYINSDEALHRGLCLGEQLAGMTETIADEQKLIDH